MHILIIEDDVDTARFIEQGLSQAGHHTEIAHNGALGLQRARDGHFDVLIVDRLLPGIDGLDIVEQLRQSNFATPVLVLSALGDTDERVTGLNAGADDYLAKPFAFSELTARLEALARRRRPELVSHKLVIGNLELDRLTRTVCRGKQEIYLKPREFRLLEYLMMHAGQVVTRTMLLEQVWDYRFDPQTNVIDVHISRLRAKIDRGFEPALLETIRGAGYRLRQPMANN